MVSEGDNRDTWYVYNFHLDVDERCSREKLGFYTMRRGTKFHQRSGEKQYELLSFPLS
jgi:hypothetical protein